MSVLAGATPLPIVCWTLQGQLFSAAPEVNCVPSSAPSTAAGWTPAVSQSILLVLSVHRLPSISNPATGEPAAGAAPVHGVIGASTEPPAAARGLWVFRRRVLASAVGERCVVFGVAEAVGVVAAGGFGPGDFVGEVLVSCAGSSL